MVVVSCYVSSLLTKPFFDFLVCKCGKCLNALLLTNNASQNVSGGFPFHSLCLLIMPVLTTLLIKYITGPTRM